MKIAVPTRNQFVDDHFGHCDMYTIFEVENKSIKGTESLASPQGCGCKSNIAGILKEKDVEMMLAGNMGNGALNKLNQQGIAVIRGCSGMAEDVVNAWLNGHISDSGEGCQQHEHHGEGHERNH